MGDLKLKLRAAARESLSRLRPVVCRVVKGAPCSNLPTCPEVSAQTSISLKSLRVPNGTQLVCYARLRVKEISWSSSWRRWLSGSSRMRLIALSSKRRPTSNKMKSRDKRLTLKNPCPTRWILMIQHVRDLSLLYLHSPSDKTWSSSLCLTIMEWDRRLRTLWTRLRVKWMQRTMIGLLRITPAHKLCWSPLVANTHMPTYRLLAPNLFRISGWAIRPELPTERRRKRWRTPSKRSRMTWITRNRGARFFKMCFPSVTRRFKPRPEPQWRSMLPLRICNRGI